MGKFRYDPEQHGDQSDQQEDAQTEEKVCSQVTMQPEETGEDYNTATQARLEHLIRTARRNKARMPGRFRTRAIELLERIMPIFNRRFPGKKVHNYQSIPPPPSKGRPSS